MLAFKRAENSNPPDNQIGVDRKSTKCLKNFAMTLNSSNASS
jgi:hypothetical protein